MQKKTRKDLKVHKEEFASFELNALSKSFEWEENKVFQLNIVVLKLINVLKHFNLWISSRTDNK